MSKTQSLLCDTDRDTRCESQSEDEHMDFVINQAMSACQSKGRGLTKNRKRVLEVLLNTSEPLSAYEIRDKYNEQGHPHIVAMSVYRILDYLTAMKLIHRLNSTNKYIGCNSQSGICEHQTPVFVICKQCQKVSELDASPELVGCLKAQIKYSGFSASQSQLEITAECNGCDKPQTSPDQLLK